MLLFAASAVLGVLPAYDRSLTNSALIAVLGSVALYFAVAHLVRSWLAVRLVSGLVLLLTTLLALVFITQYGHQNYPETPRLIEQLGGLTTLPFRLGIYLHPNATAAFLGVAVPLGAMRMISSRVFGRKLFWALCTLVMLYAFFLTVSYRGWFALIAVGLIALAAYVLRHLSRRRALTSLAIAGALGLAILVLAIDRVPALESLVARLGDQFSNSLYLARDYGFTGIGLGDTYAMVYSRYSLLIFVPFITYPNNLLLSVWLYQGVVGLVAFIGLVVSFYILVYRVMRTVNPLRRLFHGAWLGVTMALVHGLVDARQYADIAWVMPMLFVTIGLTVAAGRVAVEELDKYETPPPMNWGLRAIRLGTVAAVIAAVLVVFRQPLMAAWYTNLGAVDESRAELAPGPGSIDDAIGEDTRAAVLTEAEREVYYASAEAYYRQALDADPTYPNASRRLGNLLVKREQYDEALPLLETAFAAEPGNPAAIKGLGLAYVWVGRLEEAANTFALHGDLAYMPEELNTWGTFHSEENRPLLAARAWETAQLMGSGVNISVWMLIGDTYRSADDFDSARRWYERVLDIQPDHQEAQQALAQLG